MAAVDQTLSRESVKEKAKVVSGSYLGVLVDRLCDAFFYTLKDLEEEYNRYYAREYSSIEEFLFWRYSVPENEISRLLSTVGERNLFHGIFAKNGDHMISNFHNGHGMDDALYSIWCDLFEIDETELNEDED